MGKSEKKIPEENVPVKKDNSYKKRLWEVEEKEREQEMEEYLKEQDADQF